VEEPRGVAEGQWIQTHRGGRNASPPWRYYALMLILEDPNYLIIERSKLFLMRRSKKIITEILIK